MSIVINKTLTAKEIVAFFKITTAIFAVIGTIYYATIDIVIDKIATHVVVRIESEKALYELQKEYGKYVNSNKDSIREINLEIILKYRDILIKKHPQFAPKVAWAQRFYNCRFVEKHISKKIC